MPWDGFHFRWFYFSYRTGTGVTVCMSGEGGIRTLGSIAATPVFETGPIGHSGTSPVLLILAL
jgi:hypothetical protein